jgi:hypothetical protein
MDDARADSQRHSLFAIGARPVTRGTTMTDDGFVFGDDSDEDADEEALLGARSEDEPNTATETDRRFGTPATDDTDSRTLTHRIQTAVSGTGRTTVIALALAFVVVLGLVTYPLMIDALDMVDGPADSGASDDSAGAGGTLTATVGTTDETGATETTTTTTNAPTATPTTTVPPTTTATANTAATASPTTEATPTPTPTPTTPVPTQGFPAGTPTGTNETNDSA